VGCQSFPGLRLLPPAQLEIFAASSCACSELYRACPSKARRHWQLCNNHKRWHSTSALFLTKSWK
jgi:hypothetical protein